MVSANALSLGIWADNTLSYTGYADTVTPFITVGLGKVYSRFEQNQQALSDWSTGYKVVAGLKFDLSENSTLSVGVGHVDSGHLN
ncbi:hypothetical protein DRW07_09100 [Alteromonas sediminis]|uniref:Porin family protein n=1 Tax=Alteromonas sediminis TaxID=2259342 RepID=A0A3N5Z6P8_9ALTE|nr:hypothetical protein [Alteromonas sediminis]RPJ66244.1 hypothetical protein DRW07_09100 [Alteromonas sediminis]